MKTNALKWYVLFVMLFCQISVFAQGPGGGGGFDGTSSTDGTTDGSDPEAPIDTNLAYLAFGAVALGYFYVASKKKANA